MAGPLMLGSVLDATVGNFAPPARPMSDAEVFGAAPAAPRAMSDDEVFGSAAAPTPQAGGPSMFERVMRNAQQGWSHGTIFGSVTNFLDSILKGGVEDNLREWGYKDTLKNYQQQRAQPPKMDTAYEAMPSYSEAPTLGGRVAQGGAALTGQLLGSLFSPESLVSAGPRALEEIGKRTAPIVSKVVPKALAPVANRIAARGAEQAIINTATDPAVQGINVAAGAQDHFDPVQTALAAPLGFLVGGTLAAPGELASAFRSWRGARTPTPPMGTVAPEVAPSEAEIDAFAGSPEMANFLRANGITDPADPRVMQLEDRLAKRRGAEQVRAKMPLQDAGGAKTGAFKKDLERQAAEQAGVEYGEIDPAAVSTAGRVPRMAVETIHVSPDGAADAGDLGVREGMAAAGKVKEGIDRQASEAFTLADRQRQRAAPEVRDTQPAGRPQGSDPQTVVLDEGFPVQVQSRRTADVGGKVVEMATVQRFDPRTGQPDPESVPYDVPVRQLKSGSYAAEPRQAQEFQRRAEGPTTPERPRVPENGIQREPAQTYRATQADPNADFPGATRPGPPDGEPPPGRSPLPEQPEGPHPGPQRPRGEEDVIREYQQRQERARYQDWTGPGQGGAKSRDYRAGDDTASPVAGAADGEGRFAVDDRGFVASDKGGPVRFADQKQAAKWIINVGHKKSPDQIFEIENHPGGKGFTVRERGRGKPDPSNEPPRSDGSGTNGRSPAGGGRAAAGASPGILPPPSARMATDDVVAARADAPPVKGPKRETLTEAIRRLGGIKDGRGDVTQIVGAGNRNLKRGAYSPKGREPDKIREVLKEEGWFGRRADGVQETGTQAGDDIRDLYDLMDKEARGEPVYHPEDARTDAEMTAEARDIQDEEFYRAGIDPSDPTEVAARKLADFRASQEHDFLAAEYQRKVDEAVDGLSASDREVVNEEGYEPGADFGEGTEEPVGAAGRQDQSEDLPGWEDDTGASRDPAGGDREVPGKRTEPTQERVAGTEREATTAELRERAARREAEERQANPRAHSGKAQKPADEGLFTDNSEKNQSDMFGEEGQNSANNDIRNKFSSNPVFDPEAWKDLGRALSRNFGWAAGEADAWSRHLESITSAIPKKDKKGPGAASAVGHALQLAFYSNDGMLRSMSGKYKSDTIRKIADMFYAAPRGGRDGAVPQTYFEAMNERLGMLGNNLDKMLQPFQKMREAERTGAMEQIGRLVVNPGAIKPGTPVHDAAAGITKMLKDVLAYMREAGVDVGEVKRGYLPRIENVDAIMAKPEAFKKAAVKAFLADGVPPAEARQSAEEWFNRILMGDQGIHSDSNDFLEIGGSGNTPDFARGRVLSKKADDILGDFYLRNPADILPRYVMKAVKKAEWARRFGKRDRGTQVPRGVNREEYLSDPLGKWKDMKTAMIDQGAGEVIPEVVDIIKSITGNFGKAAMGGKRNFISLARTWSAFSYLSRATFSSLSEPVSVAIRTGNTLDGLRAYGNTVRHWAPILRKIGDGEYIKAMAEDLGFIGDSIDNLSMLARAGNDDNTLLARRLQTNFFRQIGLTQFTEANRVAAMQGGMVFMRRLAHDVTTKSHYHNMANNLLAELGISDTAKFSHWVMERDGKPHLSDLLEGGDMGRLYHTALGRFVSQTVMHPTGAIRPRYAQHPLGSLFYNLMSFTYAFQKNVLNRVGAMTKDALDPKSGLTAAERARYLMPLVNLVPLLAVQYALGEIRNVIFPDPARAGQQPQTTGNKMMTAASRAGLGGTADPLVNAFFSLRYQRDPAIALAGPIYGTPLQVAGDVGSLISDRNSPNTNTAERKAARDAYDLVVKPTLIAGATSVAPASTVLGLALGSAGIFGLAHPATREAIVGTAAGPPLPPR